MKAKKITIRSGHEKEDLQKLNAFIDCFSFIQFSAQPDSAGDWHILLFYPQEARMTAREAVAMTETKDGAPEDQLLEALKLWRKNKAREQGVAPYLICSNTTLETVAVQKPKDLESLGEIRGLGKQRISRFGKEILDIISRTEGIEN